MLFGWFVWQLKLVKAKPVSSCVIFVLIRVKYVLYLVTLSQELNPGPLNQSHVASGLHEIDSLGWREKWPKREMNEKKAERRKKGGKTRGPGYSVTVPRSFFVAGLFPTRDLTETRALWWRAYN